MIWTLMDELGIVSEGMSPCSNKIKYIYRNCVQNGFILAQIHAEISTTTLGPVLKCCLRLGPHEPCHLSMSLLCFATLNQPRWLHSQNSYITPGIQIQPNHIEVIDLIWIISA